MASNEARGIIRALKADFTAHQTRGSREACAVIARVQAQLAHQGPADGRLVSRLANYLTYTVFSNRLRLTGTQQLLVSQLIAIGRRGDGSR